MVVCSSWRDRCSLPGTPSSETKGTQGETPKPSAHCNRLGWKISRSSPRIYPQVDPIQPHTCCDISPWIMGAPSSPHPHVPAQSTPKPTPKSRWRQQEWNQALHLQVPGPFLGTELPIQKQHRSPRLVFQDFLLNSHGHAGTKENHFRKS